MKLKIIIAFTILSNCIKAQEFKYKHSELLNQWVTQSITSTKTDVTQNVEVVHSIIYTGDGKQDGIQYFKYLQEFYDGLGNIVYYDYDLISFDEWTDKQTVVQTYRTKEYNIECTFSKNGNIFQTMKISPIDGHYKHIIKVAPHGMIYNSMLKGDLKEVEEIHKKIEQESAS